MRTTPAILVIIVGLTWSGAALAWQVAPVPAEGPADGATLGELDESVRAALQDLDHEITAAAQVAEAMDELGLDSVDTQSSADRLGAKLGVSFVVCPSIFPLAGQSRIEIVVYFLPEGRAEMLEQIAIEGEIWPVVTDMLGKLVTKDGLLGAEPEPEPEPVPPSPPPDPVEPPDGGGGDGTDGQTDEDLLEGLEPIDGGEGDGEGGKGEDVRSIGVPFRVLATLSGGWSVLLNEPARGGAAARQGGIVSLGMGWIAVPKIGLEVGGDIRVAFGNSGVGFGIAPVIAIHHPVGRCLFIGGRLGLGFYKGATGSQRASFMMPVGFTLEVLVHERVLLRLETPSFTLLAGGDDDVPAVGFFGINLGLGVRF